MKWKIFLFLIYLRFKVQAIDSFSEYFYPEHKNLTNNFKQSSLNENQCEYQLNYFHENLRNSEKWAVNLVDTWAKINAGYLSGNLVNFGDFDSCVKFNHKISTNDVIQGQYCWVIFSSLPNSTLNDDRSDFSLKILANFFRNNKIVTLNGVCMPMSCSTENIINFLNVNFLFPNDLIAYEVTCRNVHSVKPDFMIYLAISIFATIIVLVIGSTTYELIKSSQSRSEPNKVLSSFSFYTNGAKLFDITKINSPNSLNCLHGMRGMSIFWILLGHRFFFQSVWGNPNEVRKFISESTIMAAIITAHPLAVDTFFVMSAVLVTWTTLRECDKRQLNIMRMIWRRYLRYTPTLAGLILFVIAFTNILQQGPLYDDTLVEPCAKNWWLALLHVQNYINQSEMCIEPSWYLSVDFQLFIISPFIILLIKKYGRKLLLIPLSIIITSTIYVICISFLYDIKMPAPRASDEYWKFIYFPTYARAGPWFIGIMFGYFLYSNRNKKFNVNKLCNSLMWVLSISILSAMVLIQFAFSISDESVSQSIHVSFMALQRNLWAISICWIIFACQHLKTGGVVRWFLSLPQWQPLSRMGLSMYLLGGVYQILMIHNQREPMFLNFWHFVPVFISDIFITTILASVSYLAFEAPPIIIEDYLFKRFRNKET